MSQIRKERDSQSEFLERFVWGTMRPKYLKAYPGVDSDQLVADLSAVTLVLVAWNELRQENFTIGKITEPELRRWANAIGDGWVISDFFRAMKVADDLLLSLLDSGSVLDTSYGCFKRNLMLGGAKPVQLQLAQPLVTTVLSSSGDNTKILALHQVFYFGKKFRCFNLDREQAAVEHFLQVDQGLGRFADPEPLKRFFTKYLSELTPPKPWMFHHSSGRTAECPRNAPAFMKDLFLGRDDLTQYAIDQGLVPGDLLPRRPFRRVGKLIPVPKDAVRDRTIVAEPTTNQWLQQGFACQLWRYISEHEYLSTRIDQRRNGAENNLLAKIGSVRGEFATLDESDASDTFYWPLALAVTDACPVLQAMLITSRTAEVQLGEDGVGPDGIYHPVPTYTMRKLAGMGSAMTFPMESLFFCAIVEHAIELCGGEAWRSRYHVHGDDIVVETQYATTVMDLLEAYGFKPNREKSFFQRRLVWNFRESCGGEYLDGVEFALCRLPRNFLGWPCQVNPDTSKLKYPAETWRNQLTDLANASFSILPAVRNYCVQKLLRYTPKWLLPAFSFDGSVGLKSYAPTNYHLRTRRNPDLQYVECAHGTWRLDHGPVSRSYSTLCYRIPKLPRSLGTLADYILSAWLFEWLRRAEAREEQILADARRGRAPLIEAIRVEGLYPQRSLWGKTWSARSLLDSSPSKPDNGRDA